MRKYSLHWLSIIVSIVFFFVSFGGCGRVGRIRPPEAGAPSSVRFFTAVGRTDGVFLQWQNPLVDASEKELTDLQLYLVQRREYKKGIDLDFETIQELSFQPEQGGIAKPEEKNDPSVSPGSMISSFLDKNVTAGRRYDYKILAVNDDGIAGRSAVTLRVTFGGEASRVENVATTITNQEK